MTRQLDVYALPVLAQDLPEDGVSVAIDVLRATTTITTALANGAERVLPFESIQETLSAKSAILRKNPNVADSLLLGGERHGLLIGGFDLDNSPRSYSREKVEGKTILFTTTNGAKAILKCRGTVYVASFLNVDAVVTRLLAADAERVSIVCAGTDGQYTEEDLALAGLVAERLTARSSEKFALNVQAEVVREQCRANRRRPLVETLKTSRGGQNLKKIKLLGDVYDAAKIDSLDVVPEYRNGEIRLFDVKRDADASEAPINE